MDPAHLQSFSTFCLVCVSSFSTSADDWHLSGLFLAIVETSSGFPSSSDRNRANTGNIRIGLVFVVLAQWKFLYCIDRFDNIKANKSRLINKWLSMPYPYQQNYVVKGLGLGKRCNNATCSFLCNVILLCFNYAVNTKLAFIELILYDNFWVTKNKYIIYNVQD